MKRTLCEAGKKCAPQATGFEFSHRVFCKWEAVTSSLQPSAKRVATAQGALSAKLGEIPSTRPVITFIINVFR